jgi:hypothetical protein
VNVAGGSKGAAIAMRVSSYLQNPHLGIAFMGNCDADVFRAVRPKTGGKVLSIYDASDEFGHSCERFGDPEPG